MPLMNHPTAEQIQDALGDKVVDALAAAVDGAAADLAEFRAALPGHASRQSSRGLANYIHDMVRARARASFDCMPGVTMVDRDQYFEVHVTSVDGNLYRIRFKRHDSTGSIATYATQAALDFHAQPDDLVSLSGTNIVHLCAGYEWSADTKTITGPVLSLRDGLFREVVWMIDLPVPGSAASGTVAPMSPPKDGPSTPVVELIDTATSDLEGTATE